MALSRPSVAAAILMALTCLLHIFGGGPEIDVPLQASDLPPYLRAIASVLWHAVTAQIAVFAIALVWVARHPNRPLSLLIAAICVAYTALFLGIGLSALHSPWPMPQWLIFATLAALTLWGTARTP